MGLPNSIKIVEVAPRDGLQNQPVPVSTADKVALIERAIAAGARPVVATAFVPPKWVPQMADVEAVMAAARSVPTRGVQVSWPGSVLDRRGGSAALSGCRWPNGRGTSVEFLGECVGSCRGCGAPHRQGVRV